MVRPSHNTLAMTVTELYLFLGFILCISNVAPKGRISSDAEDSQSPGSRGLSTYPTG